MFLDETGTDEKDAVRRFGYSVRGIPLQKQSLFVSQQLHSFQSMESLMFLYDVELQLGRYFTTSLRIIFCQNYNGINHHSVVVMNNCAIHHVPEVIGMIEDVGAIVHFCPPYSPDLNPIEMTFSKIKSAVKELEFTMPHNDFEAIMLAAFASVSPQDCLGWITHCINTSS